MPFIARCSSCNRKHKCRDRTHGKTLRCLDCNTQFVARKSRSKKRRPEQSATKQRQADEPRRPAGTTKTATKRKSKPTASQSIRDDSQSESRRKKRKEPQGLFQRLWTTGEIFPAMSPLNAPLAIVAFLALVGVIIGGSLGNNAIRTSLLFLTGGMFSIFHDQHCRAKIREEVEHYGGRVKTMSWRPWYGDFRWGRERALRYYRVRYLDRDRDEKSDMVGMSLLFGSDWDTKHDDSGWFW